MRMHSSFTALSVVTWLCDHPQAQPLSTRHGCSQARNSGHRRERRGAHEWSSLMKTQQMFVVACLAAFAGVASAEGPVNYPDEVPMVATKTRAQVKAELAEARRLGLIVYGEADVPIATPEQEKQIAEAGHRAAQLQVASK